jgi:hypothetical protein
MTGAGMMRAGMTRYKAWRKNRWKQLREKYDVYDISKNVCKKHETLAMCRRSYEFSKSPDFDDFFSSPFFCRSY